MSLLHDTGVSDCRMQAYDEAYFDAQVDGSLRSARVVVPLVVGLVKPRSVIDVGCGSGAWLRAFKESGVSRVRGIDNARYSKLLIDSSEFDEADLEQPFRMRLKYDLAVSVEVAEHLPSWVSRDFVSSLTALAPVILFSAAIPGQGGVHHINEQWPPYWQELFRKCGYRRLDAIRPHIWNDKRVEWWYRQNLFIYASEEGIAVTPLLGSENDPEFELMHPWVLNRLLTVRGLLRELVHAVWRSYRYRREARRRES